MIEKEVVDRVSSTTHIYESFCNTMLGLKVVWQKLEIVVGGYSQASKFPGS